MVYIAWPSIRGRVDEFVFDLCTFRVMPESSIVPVIILAIVIGMGAVSLAIVLVKLFVLLWTVFLLFTIFILHIRAIRTVIRTEVRIIWKMNEKEISQRAKVIKSYN